MTVLPLGAEVTTVGCAPSADVSTKLSAATVFKVILIRVLGLKFATVVLPHTCIVADRGIFCATEDGRFQNT